jgi:hypothetical protein
VTNREFREKRMNSKALSRCYPSLTARERLALILAAEGRNDTTEAARLRDSAPLRIYRLLDHAHAEMLAHTLALIYVSEQLDHAGNHLLAVTQVGEDAAGTSDWGVLAAVRAYLFCVNGEGFRRFCVGRHFDAEGLVAANYGGCLLKLAEERLSALAPDRTELVAILKAYGIADARPPTADDEFRSWKAMAVQID